MPQQPDIFDKIHAKAKQQSVAAPPAGDIFDQIHAQASSGAQPERPGFTEGFARAWGAPTTPEQAGEMITGPYGNPWDVPGGTNIPVGDGHNLNPVPIVQNVAHKVGQSVAQGTRSMVNEAREAIRNVREGGPILPNIGKAISGYTDFLTSANPVVASGAEAGKQFAAGNYGAGGGAMVAGLTQGAMLRGLSERPTGTRGGPLASRMAEKPPNSSFTRGEILNAAQEHGVNLDVADATGSAPARVTKKVVERSLGGSGVFERNTEANMGKLEEWAQGEMNNYSPRALNVEQAGKAVQSTLQQEYADLKTGAGRQFEELDQQVGSNKVNGRGIEDAAKQIAEANRKYYAAHPELKPTKVLSVVDDLATRPQIEVPDPANPGKTKLVDAPERTFTWSELHQLRSDLMDLYRNNPDLTKTRAEAWIQQLVGKIDQTMTDASAGLSQADLAKFRSANGMWENLKSTYDDPQSPLYHAVRTQNPSEVLNSLATRPELARRTLQRLGNTAGDFRRNFVQNLLDPNQDGVINWDQASRRITAAKMSQLEAVLGKDGARQVKLMGEVARRVTANVNPSGTGGVNVGLADVGAVAGAPTLLLTGHPIAAAAAAATPLAEYGVARGMTSPGVTRWATRPAVGPNPTFFVNRRVPLSALMGLAPKQGQQ